MAIGYPLSRIDIEGLAVGGYIPDAASAVVVSITAKAAVGANHLVELSDDGTEAGIQHPASAGNRCIGITAKAGADGDQVPVVIQGLAYLELGATLTAPDELGGATTGKGAAATTGHIVGATLLEDGADMNLRLVLVHGPAGYAHA